MRSGSYTNNFNIHLSIFLTTYFFSLSMFQAMKAGMGDLAQSLGMPPEAVDHNYYQNLKWMLENDVSDIPDLTFSMDADEEKHILYEKTEVSDYELKPGGGNIREKKKNMKLELLISGLPEINLNDLQANTEYSGYTAASNVVTWFWEVVKAFNKEDRAMLLQFVPLEGDKSLQGISGPQRFQIHKAYRAPERLPSAHTCFNQLDLSEYKSVEELQERLLLAIHEGSEGYGFG
ncbi:E3 ubiquitin protein ligase UPL1 [Tanacetum coccineum]